jgi:uncharacterized protein (DUF58 family)
VHDAWTQALADGERAGGGYRLRPPRRAMRGPAGTQAGALAGVSLDFSDYREYHPGDDVRNLDWQVYARSDKLTVKLYHEEISPHVDILVDASASMDLPGTRKSEACLGALALFSGAGDNAGCSRSVWRLAERPAPFPEGRFAPSRWTEWHFNGAEAGRGLVGVGTWRPLGIRVLISDLMWEVAPVRILRSLAEKAALVLVVQVLAATELSPPEAGRYRLESVEDAQTLDLRLDAGVRQRYLDLLAEHRASWEAACRQTGAVFARISDADFLATWRIPELEMLGILELA